MNQRILELLSRREWLLHDRFERADTANKAACALQQTPPHTEYEMVEMELDLLGAQIELEEAESNTETQTKGDSSVANLLKILALLAQLQNMQLVQDIEQCVLSNTTAAAIWTCILSKLTAANPSPGTPDHAVAEAAKAFAANTKL